jgi:hypothetical protein
VVSRCGRLTTKWEGGDVSGPIQGCVCGMAEKAAACIEGMPSQFKLWGGVNGVSAGGCEGSDWDGGHDDVTQDESKWMQPNS